MKDDESIPPKPSEIGGVDEPVDFKDQSVLFKFKRLKDRQPGQAWISLLYGASKTGKTYFAGTAGARTLLINIGNGIDTLLSPAFTSKYPKSAEMIVVDVREENPKGMAEAFDFVTDTINHALKHFPDSFDTIILDEATALRTFALNKAMELNTGARRVKRENRIEEYVKAELGDYGEEMSMINWFLGQYIPKFKEANKHFLMLAHERQIFSKPERQGDEATLARVLPGFTGKTFPDQVPAFFDDVFRSEVLMDGSGNAVYQIRTAGNNSIVGGTRHGGIFNTLETNPNFLEMLNRIQLAKPKSAFQLKRGN
jgi:hypothetical protein